MTRKQAIQTIIVDVATNGKVTQSGMRAYIENRLSLAAFQEAQTIGYTAFQKATK